MSHIQMVKSRDLADHLNTRQFGRKTCFFSLVLRPPFNHWPQICHLKNGLVRYSDGYCTYNKATVGNGMYFSTTHFPIFTLKFLYTKLRFDQNKGSTFLKICDTY